MLKRKKKMAGLFVSLFMGAQVFQLSGCDPTVRGTLITGLEATTNSLVDTLITAFFITLDDEADGGGGGVTTT